MIREANMGDYLTVKELLKNGVAEGTLQPRKKKEIKKSIKRGRTVVAEVDSKIVGTASVSVYDRRIAEIRSVYVVPQRRGNGIARGLIQGVLERPVSILPSATIFAITSSPRLFEGEGFTTGIKTNTSERHIRMKSI